MGINQRSGVSPLLSHSLGLSERRGRLTIRSSSLPRLTPGSPRQMLREGPPPPGRELVRLDDSTRRWLDAFECLLSKQIEAHSGGLWSSARGMGTGRCSIIFLGRQGEGVDRGKGLLADFTLMPGFSEEPSRHWYPSCSQRTVSSRSAF